MKRTVFVLKSAQCICAAAFVCCSVMCAVCALPEDVAKESINTAPTAGTSQSAGGTEDDKCADEPTPPGEGGDIIVNVDLSTSKGPLEFSNETGYSFDPEKILSAGYPIEPVDGDSPAVLILHTHATECYTEQGQDRIGDTRSPDPEKNMIAVGKVIAETLEACGVPTLHCTKMHDLESYSEAYELSCESAVDYLEKHPSIKYVLDVHRDAIGASGGGMARAAATLGKSEIAQVMIVVGTNEGGADHPGWKTNLCVALNLQLALDEACEGWARPVNLRKASFNQQYAPGSLLIEIGTCANTLEEAKSAAKLFAKCFADTITN